MLKLKDLPYEHFLKGVTSCDPCCIIDNINKCRFYHIIGLKSNSCRLLKPE